jgi:hypothetical protein
MSNMKKTKAIRLEIPLEEHGLLKAQAAINNVNLRWLLAQILIDHAHNSKQSKKGHRDNGR